MTDEISDGKRAEILNNKNEIEDLIRNQTILKNRLSEAGASVETIVQSSSDMALLFIANQLVQIRKALEKKHD